MHQSWEQGVCTAQSLIIGLSVRRYHGGLICDPTQKRDNYFAYVLKAFLRVYSCFTRLLMADIEKLSSFEKAENVATVSVQEYAPVNASGHRDQLDRQYSLLSICATALTIDNAWPVLGGSVAYVILPFCCSILSVTNHLALQYCSLKRRQVMTEMLVSHKSKLRSTMQVLQESFMSCEWVRNLHVII